MKAKKAILGLVFFELIFIIVYFFYTIPLWLFGVPIVSVLLFFSWGSYYINSGVYLKVVSKGLPIGNQLSITFDDGPDPSVTPLLLEILKKHNVKAVFFCIGKNIPGNERLLKQIVEEGHLIGNHTFSHSFFLPFYSWKHLRDDIDKTNREIERITGLSPRWFRPPFGVTSPPYRKALNTLQMIAVGWTVRSLDTVIKDPEKLFKRTIRKIHPGALLLFHDNHVSIVPFVDRFLNYSKENSINIVNPDELLNLNPYVVG